MLNYKRTVKTHVFLKIRKIIILCKIFVYLALLDTFLASICKEQNSPCGCRGLRFFFSFIGKTFSQDIYVSFGPIYTSLGLCVSFQSEVSGFNSIQAIFVLLFLSTSVLLNHFLFLVPQLNFKIPECFLNTLITSP